MNSLSLIMLGLIGFVTLNVALFARRYLSGDRNYWRFKLQLALIFTTLTSLVLSDHLAVFWLSWSASNYLLVQLMIHKKEWPAAKASGKMSLINLGLGSVFLGVGFVLLYFSTGTLSIDSLVSLPIQSYTRVALTLLFLAAMTQSALWPFNRWLLSSLNSPTPVSALMHAGLVNGGGYLLVRFAPLYLQSGDLMNVIFIFGLLSAVLGTLYKLIQSDVKRMLACSTMGQMGFMIAQCGLGLFPAAVAHLCWHGMFKAYLFLASGNAAKEKHLELGHTPTKVTFIIGLIWGALGSYAFAYMSDKPWITYDTTIILNLVAFIALAQLAIAILKEFNLSTVIISLGMTITAGGLYGLSVYFITLWLPVEINSPLPLNIFHLGGGLILTLTWLIYIYGKSNGSLWRHVYVRALNASQPYESTITTHRKSYHY